MNLYDTTITYNLIHIKERSLTKNSLIALILFKKNLWTNMRIGC